MWLGIPWALIYKKRKKPKTFSGFQILFWNGTIKEPITNQKILLNLNAGHFLRRVESRIHGNADIYCSRLMDCFHPTDEAKI